MMLTTGILMFGKMSVGVRKMASTPPTKMRMLITTKVYGRRSASCTIHIFLPHSASGLPGRLIESRLRPVLGGFRIQGRDHQLRSEGNRDPSGQNESFCRNLPAVHTLVVPIVRTDRRAFERHSGK